MSRGDKFSAMVANVMAIYNNAPPEIIELGADWYSSCARSISGPDFRLKAALISLPKQFMLWKKSLPLVEEALRFGSMYRQHEEIILTAQKIIEGHDPLSVIRDRGKRTFYRCLVGEERDSVPLDLYSKSACFGRQLGKDEYATYDMVESVYQRAFDKINSDIIDTPAKMVAAVRHCTYRHGFNLPGVTGL